VNNGILIPEKLLARRIPKLGMNKDEVIFSYASAKLVRELISKGKLKGKKSGTTLLFDAEHVEHVWKQWQEGAFDNILS
jgi:hypothetical protein